MAQLHVELVSPERKVWSGDAHMVVAKTTDGDIGVLPNHVPVLGTFAEGSVLRVLDEQNNELLRAAVHGGFLSVADNHVSVLAESAELGDEVDVEAARSAYERGLASLEDEDARAEAKRAQARLRAAGVEV
ncbi:MAG: F0F1 ATP synthase subunit epsilon [Streptosporangiales bacterium]|nr:F0F1 ATP synthase subunit epsilon [Streptosporangiales bacterium]